MQQLFPAGSIQRIVISDIEGDLIIHGWAQQDIEVKSSEELSLIQPEGDALLINSCADTLELRVPFEAMITANNIEGDVIIEEVRQVVLADVEGDVVLRSLNGDAILSDLSSDLRVERAATVRVEGELGSDAILLNVNLVEIENTGSDLRLKGVQEARLGQIGSDLDVRGGIIVLRCLSVGSDCFIEGDISSDIMIENVGSDLTVSGVQHLQIGNVASDCRVQNGPTAEIMIGNVASDLTILGAQNVQVGNVGGDCEVRDVTHDLSLGQVSSDANCSNIRGNLQINSVGGDARLLNLHGSCNVNSISGDLQLQSDFLPESSARLLVANDARITIPEHANLTVRAQVSGSVSGRSTVSSHSGGSNNSISLVYGEGYASLELLVGGDLTLRGSEDPRSSSSHSGAFWGDFLGGVDFGEAWADFGREMADFGREMADFGRDLGLEISDAVTGATSFLGADIADEIARSMHEHNKRIAEEHKRRAQRMAEEHKRRTQQMAEEQRRRSEEMKRTAEERARRLTDEQKRRAEERSRRLEEQKRRAEEQRRRSEAHISRRIPRLNIRIHDREWRMDQKRIEHIIEQAQRAASEGVYGALEAVEQALKNLSIIPPVPPMPPMPTTPPTPDQGQEKVDEQKEHDKQPAEETTSDPAPISAAEKEETINPEQEREAILRMIAEGRITPEEGDLLLEALGN